MSNKETNEITPEPSREQQTSSAPELPHEIAKQYGLHHAHDGGKAAVETSASPKAAVSEEKHAAADTPAEPETPFTDDVGEPANDSVTLDDSKTDAAVDDILTREGDQLLAVQDGSLPPVPVVAPKRRGFWRSIGHFFVAWWRNKWARWITIVLLLAVISVVAFIPKTRYAALNAAGVRSSASVIVLDDTTQLPLKNVAVSLGSQKEQTDHNGVAKFTSLKLGTYQLTIKRIAFASHSEQVTIGWGSNPLGSYKLQATGTQYTIMVSDYLSGNGIVGAEATSDQAVAQSDKNGKIVLTVADTNVTSLAVTVSADGYRSQALTLNAASSTTSKVVLVPAQKEVFVSKQTGTYDVYTIDLDGTNRRLILSGTGNEGPNMSLVMSPDGKRAALVSTRDNVRDSDGFLLQALTIIDISAGTSVTVDHAEQIQPVDWQGSRLIYRTTLAGASAADSQRSRLISYDYDSNARLQLATANQFNAILSALGNIYYTVSSTDPHATLGLFKIKADGSGRQRLTQDEIWTALRVNYSTLSLQTPNGWTNYNMQSGQSASVSAPANVITYQFAENSQSSQSAWVDVRDGNGTLLLHDDAKGTDKTLVAKDGLTYPVRWVNDSTLVYRVANSIESADYAVSTNGGQPHKIVDVTAAYGYAQIY
jgi:hypothetical protein